MISIDEFIKMIKNMKNEVEIETFVNRHIVTKYVPYTQKLVECKNIVKLSSYKKINDEEVYWKNTPNQTYLFQCRLIANYTDIDIDMSMNALDVYDKLCENNIFELIMTHIPVSEYNIWSDLLSMVDYDEEYNMRSLPAYLDTKINAMNLATSSISDALEFVMKNNG